MLIVRCRSCNWCFFDLIFFFCSVFMTSDIILCFCDVVMSISAGSRSLTGVEGSYQRFNHQIFCSEGGGQDIDNNQPTFAWRNQNLFVDLCCVRFGFAKEMWARCPTSADPRVKIIYCTVKRIKGRWIFVMFKYILESLFGYSLSGKPMGAVSAFMVGNYLYQPFDVDRLMYWM